MILLSVVGFLVAALVAGLIVRWGRKHAARYGNAMPQRFHLGDIPRIGGAALLIGMAMSWGLGMWQSSRGDPGSLRLDAWVGGWLLGLLPASLGGISQYMTQRLSVRYRLILTGTSGALAVLLLDLALPRLGWPWLDALLASAPWLGVVIVVLAIAGLPHAFNIIDGYNGLAGMVALIVCLALAHVAMQVGDRALAPLLVFTAPAPRGVSDLELSAWHAVCRRWWRLCLGRGDCPGQHLAGAAQCRCVAMVPDAAVDLSGLGDDFLDLQEGRSRHLARRGRRAAFSSTDLPPHRARRVPRSRVTPGADAQQPHLALSVGLYAAHRDARSAVLEQHPGVDGVLRLVRDQLCAGLPGHRALQGAALVAPLSMPAAFSRAGATLLLAPPTGSQTSRCAGSATRMRHNAPYCFFAHRRPA